MKKFILGFILFTGLSFGSLTVHADDERAPETPIVKETPNSEELQKKIDQASSMEEVRTKVVEEANKNRSSDNQLVVDNKKPIPMPEGGLSSGKTKEKEDSRIIIGNDDRQKADVSKSPFKQTAQIEMLIGSSWYIGSGTMIGGNKVLTAGHVVYEMNNWATYVIVTPGLNNGVPQPGATSVSTKVSAPLNYVTNLDENFDMGIIILEKNLGFMGTVGYTVPNEGAVNSALVSGYPGDKNGGIEQWYGNGSAIVGPQLISYTIDTAGGQSGGPIINNANGQIIGVHTSGTLSANIGVRITQGLKGFIEAVN